jgi:hypothetical protein
MGSRKDTDRTQFARQQRVPTDVGEYQSIPWSSRVELGAQNRTMNVTVLVPAKSQTSIPVSCVEAHRWNTSTGLFNPAVLFGPLVMRG